MAVTIKDVAEVAKVSISAVSYAIHNSGPVSEEKRERIMKAIEDLGYVQNGMARSMRLSKKGLVGYFANSLSGVFYGEVLKGIEDVFSKNERELVAGKCMKLHNGKMGIRLLTERMVDGAIIFSSSISNEVIEKLAAYDFPIVVLDRELHGRNISCVLIDNEGSSYKVGQHIYNLGLTKVACLIGPGYDGEQRLKGFRKAVKEFDLEMRPEWVINGNWLEKDAHTKIIELARKQKMPEVIFAFNDEMAMGCMDALKEMWFRIPKDISVIGMDDIRMSAFLEPKLTTVHRPLYELGVTAAETLLQMIDGKESKKIILPTYLIQRESCIKHWVV